MQLPKINYHVLKTNIIWILVFIGFVAIISATFAASTQVEALKAHQEAYNALQGQVDSLNIELESLKVLGR